MEPYPIHTRQARVRGIRGASRRASPSSALLLAVALASPLSAQESGESDAWTIPKPNSPEQLEQADQAPRWASVTELTLTDASGNNDMTVFTTGFTLRHLRTELYSFELQLQGRYGASDGEQVAENYKGSLTFDFAPGSRWSPFLHTTAEHDPFRRLDVRMNSGAGARYRLYREQNRGEADISVAMMHSYEALRNEGITATTNRARWNVRVNGSRRVHEGVTVSHRTQYQPIVDQLGDYLLTMETGLRVHLNNHVALSVSHEFNRDSMPAADVHPDDRLLKAGVQVQL